MIDLRDYGFIPQFEQESNDFIPARVTAVHRDSFEVICCFGEIDAKLKTGVYFQNSSEQSFPTTGDFVMIQYNEKGKSLIVKTLERKSKFARADFSGHAMGYAKTVLEQAVAANFDYVFILSSLNQEFNVKRIERYLTLAWQSGGIPVIVLTKADLSEDYTKQILETQRIATDVGVFAVSATTGYGLDQLSQYFKPSKTIVFLGSSGVGKSSLVNALAKEEIMKVNVIRDSDSKGRHTTTHRQLSMLKNGVMVIDTPGMRGLGMWDVNTGLSETFAEIENILLGCKFSDCTHTNEPGCAIKVAIADGTIDEARWQNFCKLKKEAKFSNEKSANGSQKWQNGKTTAKLLSRNKKLNGRIYDENN